MALQLLLVLGLRLCNLRAPSRPLHNPSGLHGLQHDKDGFCLVYFQPKPGDFKESWSLLKKVVFGNHRLSSLLVATRLLFLSILYIGAYIINKKRAEDVAQMLECFTGFNPQYHINWVCVPCSSY